MADFTEIVKGVWMGGETLPILPPGFDAVCSCRLLEDICPVMLPGVALLQIPFIDGPRLPPVSLMTMGAQFLHVAEQSGLRALVHCAEGRNRSGLIMGVFLILGQGMEPQEAIDLIRSKRPAALSNQTFVDYLLTLGGTTW